jgi:hypothetical protein
MAEPWISRSAWALAPYLFLWELFILFCSTLVTVMIAGQMVDVGSYSIVSFGMICYLSYNTGKKATLEAGERPPRKRLAGAAALIGVMYWVSFKMLYQATLPEVLEILQKQESPEAKELLANLPKEDQVWEALFPAAFLFYLIHWLFLSLGAKRGEKLIGGGNAA